MANQNDSEKYAYLDQLSTERLEALLRADIESPDNTNDEVIFHILEVMKKREQEHPTGRLVDVDEAWAEFQQHYNTPEGEGLSLYPTTDEEHHPDKDACETTPTGLSQRPKTLRLRPTLKTAGIAAAIVVAIFATLITVQAAGIDVFGAIGRWTENTFHFVMPSGGSAQSGMGNATMDTRDSDTYNAIQSALNECGITENLVPTLYPDGFEASEPEIIKTDQYDIIHIGFSDANENFFSIDITLYQSISDLTAHTFEKDTTTVEEYTSGAKTFYILSNMDTVTATYSEGLMVEQLSGNLSLDEIKAIIDSIGVL